MSAQIVRPRQQLVAATALPSLMTVINFLVPQQHRVVFVSFAAILTFETSGANREPVHVVSYCTWLACWLLTLISSKRVSCGWGPNQEKALKLAD
jgi:hypothetical protein